MHVVMCCLSLPPVGPLQLYVKAFKQGAFTLISCDSQTHAYDSIVVRQLQCQCAKGIIHRIALDAMQICVQVLHIHD